MNQEGARFTRKATMLECLDLDFSPRTVSKRSLLFISHPARGILLQWSGQTKTVAHALAIPTSYFRDALMFGWGTHDPEESPKRRWTEVNQSPVGSPKRCP